MTYFIRTKDNKTIIDIDFFKNETIDDVSSVVDLIGYTETLLSLPKEKLHLFCFDMSQLQEIRGIWFEGFVNKYKDGIKNFAKEFMLMMCEKWDLCFVED